MRTRIDTIKNIYITFTFVGWDWLQPTCIRQGHVKYNVSVMCTFLNQLIKLNMLALKFNPYLLWVSVRTVAGSNLSIYQWTPIPETNLAATGSLRMVSAQDDKNIRWSSSMIILTSPWPLAARVGPKSSLMKSLSILAVYPMHWNLKLVQSAKLVSLAIEYMLHIKHNGECFIKYLNCNSFEIACQLPV